MYNSVHTSFDVMKEFLITGAELGGGVSNSNTSSLSV